MFHGLITLVYTNIYKYILKVNRSGNFFLKFFFGLTFAAAAVHPSAFDFRTPAASGPASRRSGPRPTPGPLRRIHRPAIIDVGSLQARSASTSAARSLPEALALRCYVVRKSGRAGAGVYIYFGVGRVRPSPGASGKKTEPRGPVGHARPGHGMPICRGVLSHGPTMRLHPRCGGIVHKRGCNRKWRTFVRWCGNGRTRHGVCDLGLGSGYNSPSPPARQL